MEDFRGIADESFPSFLTNSLLGNNGTLENVTFSSNLGLPVAVSTLARNRASTNNRYSDIQASYLLEGRFSVPSESSPNSQSEAEPGAKLQLSFQDDDSVSRRKNHIESQHLSDTVLKESAFPSDIAKTEEKETKTAESFQSQDPCVRILPLEQVQDSSVGFCLQSWMNNKENKVAHPDAGKHFEDKNPNNDLSHASLIENEKLMSLTSLEDSSDGDIDDEEFYDDHLEAYFEKLAIPGMIYEDQEGQELPEKDFKLPVGDSSEANENGSLSCKSQSENNSCLISHVSHSSRNSETTHKESEDGHVFCLSGISNSIGNGNSRRHDGVLPFSSNTLRIAKEKESAESSKGSVLHCDKKNIREEVPEKTIRVANAKPNADYFHDTNVNKDDFDLINPFKLESESPHQSKHLASATDTEIPQVFIQKNVNLASLKPISDKRMNSTIFQSPTSKKRTCEYYESVEKSKDQYDLPQNVVYQDEEGRWVTDLAYYTSFNEEQDLNMPLTDEMNEDFRTGSEAMDLIAQDEEEFNKEHQFMQEENIDAQNTSFALGDVSWGTSINYNLLRKSLSTSDLNKDDASYLRLSLGEFFAQRSEALGCLGGGYNVKRPSFGYFIKSPEKREPVALIGKSDLSRSNLENDTAHLNHDLFSGDLNEQFKPQLSEGSVTLQAEELESISQVDENDVTLTNNEGITEDTLFLNSRPQSCKGTLPEGGDSILRISTIASAIANASVSTDPSQLAAMIKALSNKTREKTLQEDDKQKDSSVLSHFLSNDSERNNGSSVFDMEKYLKKTEISSCKSGLEKFSRADVSDIWDLSLLKEGMTKDIHTVDLGASSISIRESEENTVAIFYGENGKSENQESFRTINSSNSILTSTREYEGTVVDVKTHSIGDKLPDIGNSEKVTSISISTSNSYSLVKSPRVTSLWPSEECEEMQNNRGNQRQNEYVSETSNCEKHVTFGNHFLIPPKNVDLKNPPEHGGHNSEDDQDSFRPSTSPLSHSSPSEISGTSLSGCALEFSGSAAHHQKSPCKNELSQLMCPQANVSRLTYVSEQESTCPTTASGHVLEDCKSDITSELSTTIIRASPIPSEEQAVEKLREKGPFQSKGKGALSHVIQKNSGTEKVTETTSLCSKLEDIKPDFRFNKDISSKSGHLLETTAASLTTYSSELDQIGLGHLTKSGLRHPVVSAVPCFPVPLQASVNESERVTSEDTSTTNSALSGQVVPHQMTSGHQCAPIPSSMVYGSAPEMQNMPTSVPTLLTRHSFTTAPFSQKYLGTLPAAGNVALPQCCAGSTTADGFSGNCSYPAVTGEYVQNSVAIDICLGQNTGSALMGTSSLCNPPSNTIHQNLLNTAKSFPVQSFGANCGIEPWDSGVMSGLGHLRVPEELKFPHACCVGIASQTHLSVLNPTAHWLQVSIGVLSVSVNGEKVDLLAYPCLVFKNKVIIRPHATEEIKVLFIPSDPGIFRCIFSVASWPVTADAIETAVQAEALASRVILTAIAETPVIEVETEKKDVLDFGDLTYGGWKALPLKLINKTHAIVPVRLTINANAIAWRCFTFSKEPIHVPREALPYADMIAYLAAPSVINHMMPASYDGQDPEFFIIWVLFHSPMKQITSSEILDSAEEFLARVDIEVDSPNTTPVIKSISLRARTGIARIHAPKDLQTMHLFASMTSSTKQHLPLKNAGNIDVYLDIKIPDQGSHFSVVPETLFLKPGEEREVIVSFTPKDPKASEERILKIFVQPFGPQYEVALKGEVVPSRNKPLAPGSCCSDIPSILSNKQFLAWGGVPLGTTQYLPTLSSCPESIPLSGYGGTSNVILEGVKKLSDSYMVTMNDLIPGKESRIVFSVCNTGCRAAFVKAVGFMDSQKKVFLDPKVLRIFPDKFVLKEKTQEDVTIIYNPPDRDSNHKIATELYTIYFFVGDEISRQQYRRALLHTPGIVEHIFPEHSVLQSIDFAEGFQHELLVTEVYDLPQQPSDVQLFYGNMSKITFSIIGEFRDSSSSRECFQPSSKANLESKSESDSLGKHGGNVSLDVLPVKGPQSSPLSQVVYPPQDKSSSEEMWTVQPEHLILVAPSTCELAKTGRFQILNSSVRLLKFELYWPAHCLTVTPQYGFIQPESKLQILVSPNSSLSTKHSVFPWSGLIYIHCDNGQKKIVKVQIREELTQEELSNRLASSSFGFPSVTEPLISHLVKPMTKPPSTKVEIRNKTVTFPTTEPGETSENYLELENHGNTEVKWYLSSLAPPYVKGVDESGDVFRATYAAFRCSPISGIMESHGIQKVSITFLPRDKGDYAQFWDVECHPLKEPHTKHTLRFQLSGQSIKAENEPENLCISTNTLIKIDNLVKSRRQAVSEASAVIPRQLDLTHRGVYASEDVYWFLPTRVGESRTLKVNLRNNSFITHLLKFLSPREPFYIKHSKYSLRAQHYINMPVQFKPKLVGTFEASLIIQTDEGKSIAIRLIGEALEKN
ncbi:centrosomal protein of 192 kDa [Sturnira hondurensis]|uniref:centrosomal protein of 192 kDa n=1 Tax=Sturnira hondurensis TaxID=192404 RepID=UPI00187A8213|nr:centrosomal protein of 192 kDa [Sturnira hondurensis]